MPIIFAFLIIILMTYITICSKAVQGLFYKFRKVPDIVPGRGQGREAFETIMESRGYNKLSSSDTGTFKRDTALNMVLNKIASTTESKVMFLAGRGLVVGYYDELVDSATEHVLVMITPSKHILILE